MEVIIDYQKENSELTGAIMINKCGNSQYNYIAVTVSTSKAYKSMKGAEKFMNKYNYKKC